MGSLNTITHGGRWAIRALSIPPHPLSGVERVYRPRECAYHPTQLPPHPPPEEINTNGVGARWEGAVQGGYLPGNTPPTLPSPPSPPPPLPPGWG